MRVCIRHQESLKNAGILPRRRNKTGVAELIQMYRCHGRSSGPKLAWLGICGRLQPPSAKEPSLVSGNLTPTLIAIQLRNRNKPR